MNNNSTLFYEYTLNGKIEINDIKSLSLDLNSYNDVYKKLNEFRPKVSSNLVNLILKFARK